MTERFLPYQLSDHPMNPRSILGYPLAPFSHALRSHKSQRYIYHYRSTLPGEANTHTWLCLVFSLSASLSVTSLLKSPPNKLQFCFVLGHSEILLCCEVKNPSFPWVKVSENDLSSCYWWQCGTVSPSCALQPPTPCKLRVGKIRIFL